MCSSTSIIVFMYLSVHFIGILPQSHSSTDRFHESESWKELHAAIEAGNENEIKRLLMQGVNVNGVDDKTGNTALILAAQGGYKEVVEELLENGANINAVNIGNSTALILAIENGHDEIAELLIQNDADVNVVNNYGTALTWAADNGMHKIAQILIEKGANLNAVDEFNTTALIFGVLKERESIARLLVENGADLNVVNDKNNTALILAIDKGYDKIAELLIQFDADVNIVTQFGNTALISAAEKGFEKIVQMLIDKGASINAVDEQRASALIVAAWKGQENAVRVLIRNGADLNIVNKYGDTALSIAIREGHEKVIRILVDKFQSASNVGDPVLVDAATKGSEKGVRLLIKNGANVNAANEYGTTALMVAAKIGNEKIIKLLIENDATEINAVDKDGHTALDAVNIAFEGHEKLIRLLEQRGAVYKGVELYRRISEKACKLYSNLTSRWRYGTGTRVFDGSLAETGEFPWMVALGYSSRQFKISFSCGGSLISDTFVLTAAHCAKDNRRPIVARLGQISLSDEDGFQAENQNIEQIILHPEYSIFTKKNDIALIRLIDRLLLTEFIQPICLQTDLKDVDTRVDLIVSGWGQTNSGRPSNDLLKIDLKTMSLADCNANLLDYNKKRNLASLRGGVDESQYCAHDPVGHKDSCQGDSGGPLQAVQSYSSPAKVVGVVSFGIGCGRGRPGIYTRVAHYIEWIGSHVWPNGRIDTPRININDV